MYSLNTNIYPLTREKDGEDKIKQVLLDWEKQLVDRTIRFKRDQAPKSFGDLIYKFFYKRLSTYEGRKKQCIEGRRRSLIDFFLLQKHYLKEPLSMEQCYDIYFNKLFRNIEEYRKSIKSYVMDIDDAVKRNFTHYYCPTVNRNVFVKHYKYEIFNPYAAPKTEEELIKEANIDQFNDYKVEIVLNKRKVSEVIYDAIQIKKEVIKDILKK